MRLLAFFLLVMWGLPLAFAGKEAPAAMRSGDSAMFVDGVATINKTVAGHKLKITVETRKTSTSPFKGGFRWGGEDARAPSTLITSVIVQRGNERLFVPLSAYVDLGDPRRVSLKQSTNGFDLDIAGGDAGVSYQAVLTFDRGWLTRRRVTHGEFPDEAWEETRYAYNALDN